jgi:hypothetical protein
MTATTSFECYQVIDRISEEVAAEFLLSIRARTPAWRFSGNWNYVRDGANQALNRLVKHSENVEGATVRV